MFRGRRRRRGGGWGFRHYVAICGCVIVFLMCCSFRTFLLLVAIGMIYFGCRGPSY